MAEEITLAHFGAQERKYHIYRIQNSKLAHLPHYHSYFQVCFVIRGEILHSQGSREVTLGPGDAFIIPPGFTHSIHFHNAYSEIYSLSFDPGLLRNEFSQAGILQFLETLQAGEAVRLRVMPDKNRRKMLQNLLDCLVLQLQTQTAPELSPAAGIITSIMYLLAQSYYEHPDNAGSRQSLSSSNALAQCTQYIDEHFREKLSIGELAHRFGLSRSSFCTVFPQFAGMSPGRYIAHKRIQEAQLLIRSRQEMPLGQIAIAVGYEDGTTFYRNFLQITGMSPGKYRQHCREDSFQGGTV